MLNKIEILGVGITVDEEKKVLEEVVKAIKTGKKFTIVTPNPEIMVYAKKHKLYQTILNSAWIALPDGVGLVWAAKLLRKPLKTRITGVDFIEKLCQVVKEKPVSMGFLGGEPGIAERAVECLREKCPWIKVSFVGQEWDQTGFRAAEKYQVASSKYQVENKENAIHDTKYMTQNTKKTIDLLFVAYGFPKQEEWIAKNLEELPITGAIGVGGSFDYLSGAVMRAPGFVRAAGFEWLFRLIRQPWRWKRQLALLEFIWMVVKEKLRVES